MRGFIFASSFSEIGSLQQFTGKGGFPPQTVVNSMFVFKFLQSWLWLHNYKLWCLKAIII